MLALFAGPDDENSEAEITQARVQEYAVGWQERLVADDQPFLIQRELPMSLIRTSANRYLVTEAEPRQWLQPLLDRVPGGACHVQGGAGVEASIGHTETLPVVCPSPARPTSSVTTAFAHADHVPRRPFATSIVQPHQNARHALRHPLPSPTTTHAQPDRDCFGVTTASSAVTLNAACGGRGQAVGSPEARMLGPDPNDSGRGPKRWFW